MHHHFQAYLAVISLAMLLVSCTSAPAPTTILPTLPATAVPKQTAIPTKPPEPTSTPTATPVPPTATATVQPMKIDPTQVALDKCPIVELNIAGWKPLSASYRGGSDPFYQFHDNEAGFYFNVELYTVYGAGWTGQLGTFKTDCTRNGICVYLVPDDKNPYLATAGDVTIGSLAQANGSISGTVALTFAQMTMKPVPGSKSTGCYHIDEAVIFIED